MIYFCIWWLVYQQQVVSIMPVPEKLTVSSVMCLEPVLSARKPFLYVGSRFSCLNTVWLIWPAREQREGLNHRKWQQLGEILCYHANDCPIWFKYELSCALALTDRGIIMPSQPWNFIEILFCKIVAYFLSIKAMHALPEKCPRSPEFKVLLVLNLTLDYEVMRRASMPQAETSLVSLLLSVLAD